MAMKLVLKIAAGVFLGIFAVFIMLEIPDWRRQSNQAHASLTITSLTPEQVIAHCGKPTEDQTMDFSPGISLRYIIYENLPDITDDAGKVLWPHPKVQLSFDKMSGFSQWHFTKMGFGVSDRTGGPATPTVNIDNPVEELTDLPCLNAVK
jgi:hypothetical protein